MPKAKGRFRALMTAGSHITMENAQTKRIKRSRWEGGEYENEYLRDSSIWKIFRLRCQSLVHSICVRRPADRTFRLRFLTGAVEAC